MPGLRDRSLLKPPDVFLPWQEGDPHTPMALRWKEGKERKKTKAKNKKYRDIKKNKAVETKKDEKKSQSETEHCGHCGQKPMKKSAAKVKVPVKIKMSFKKK